MSHKATKWAFDQPELHCDMKPNEWAVLVVLADCHNPVNGTFPSIEYLVAHTNLSDRSVRDQLMRLRERRLVNWEEQRVRGHRDVNRYFLGFEDDFQPAEFADSPTGKSEQDQPANHNTANRQSLPPHMDEPVKEEPVSEPERENAREDREAERETSKLWADLKREYPGAAKDNLADAERLFRTRTLPAQRKAIGSLPAWMTYLGPNPKRRVMLQDYVRDARWELIPADVKATAAKAAAPETVYLNAYGREWWWLFGRSKPGTFLQKRIDLARQSAIGWPVPADRVAEINVAAETLTHFRKDSAHFRAWCTYWRTLGIDAPIPDKAEWVFLPDHGPPSAEQGQAERVSLSEGAG